MTSNYGGVYPERSRRNAIYELLQTTQGGSTTESYTYDPVGNRLSSLGLSPYSTNTSNELTSTPSTSYTYDYNGNTTSKTVSGNTTNYTWDFENRLASVVLPGTGGTATFKYDPFGRRIQKVFAQNSTTTTTNYLYDADNSAEEVDQNGNLLARHTRTTNIDEPLAESRSGTTSYYDADGLGSVTSLSSTAGALTNAYTYDSFGNLTASTGSLTNPFRYTAREFDPETSVYFYRARHYDAQSGRFLSEDKLRFGSGGVHFYSYVDNDPIDYRDPSGRKKWHGNWCGPDWTGGLVEEYNPSHASSYAKPIDDLDNVCMHHDISYFKCRSSLPCDPDARSNCMRQCDNVMTGEALPIIVNQNWGWGYAIWWAIKLHRNPDPGTNVHCGCYNLTRIF